MNQHAIERSPDEKLNWITSLGFFAIHALALGALVTGVTAKALVLCVVLYFGRMWFITAGYHRYFAHRSYKTSRAFQLVLAFGGSSAAQKGPLWWASHHRNHHRFSDTEADLHSPLKGFWWSHVGWILCDKNNAWDPDDIRDFAKYPELRFINTHDWIAPWTVAIAAFLIGGWSGLVVGFFWSTVLLWHGTFTVNSLAHVMGRRRYATTDTSRNSALIALWTGGEGWHNNHHHYQASARNGFFWWEYDPTYYLLKALSWLHIVRELKVPPARVLQAARVRDGQFDMGMFKAHWGKATAALHTTRNRTGPAHAPADAPAPLLVAATADAERTGRPADEAVAGDASRLEQLEDRIRVSRLALEQYVASSLRSAEELATLSRRRQREVG